MALPLSRLRSDLRSFLGIVVALNVLGLIFIYSSSSIFALEKCGSAHYFLKKQFFFLIPSVLGFFAFALVPLEKLKRATPWLFLMSLFLTALTFVPFLASRCHGSNRWLNLGFIGFQPSELLKLFLFMYMGYFLEKKQNRIKSFLYTYLPFLAILGVSFIILLKQPDFGSVVTIFSTSLILFFVAECKMTYLLITALASCPLVVYLIVAKSYRLNRILIFLNPWSDPQGKGFQIIQSLIAIGSGQMWGLGVSNSKQKFFYLPMQHTDFIFPIIAEEVGFVGSMLLIGLYLLFCFLGMRIALGLQAPFSFFTTLGFVVFITLQTLINLMVTAGLLPTKGLGLPFISYGGTALVCLWCMIGFVVNAVRSER
jgi:cell division protein FtsW